LLCAAVDRGDEADDAGCEGEYREQPHHLSRPGFRDHHLVDEEEQGPHHQRLDHRERVGRDGEPRDDGRQKKEVGLRQRGPHVRQAAGDELLHRPP
jgi:hypothetical protein